MSDDLSRVSGCSRRRWLRAVAAAAGAGLVGSARAAHVVRPWPDGKPAPSLELLDLAGRAWSLSAQAGRVVVMNFWATWCEPCRAEMPSLEALWQRHERDGVVVVAINYRETVPAIRRFLQVQPLALPILLDPDGAAAAAWTPRVFPSTVLVDRRGRPRETVLGELDWSSPVARELIEPLLARSRTT